MAIIPANPVPEHPPEELNVFICAHCATHWKVNKWSDMRRSESPSTSTPISVWCPSCKMYLAIPEAKSTKKLVLLYDQWLQLQLPIPTWHNVLRCPDCLQHSEVTAKNMTYFNETGSGDTWNPVVYLHCPNCFSDTPAKNFSKIPQGVIQYVLDVAEEDRERS